MRGICMCMLFCCTVLGVQGQDSVKMHTLSLDEYQKAKTFRVKDLDNDTYVKFDNTYVLDRYESRKPYFITGDDGMKKRVDLYRLIFKEGRQELGTVIYYTNEKGTLYAALLPAFRAAPAVWEKYFTDIHAIDKEEPNFVLKLSYVLSREFGFQQYKSANQGKDISREAGTYGMDICFPGNTEVMMEDGTRKPLADISSGDRVLTIDPASGKRKGVAVTALVSHPEKNYAITHLVLVHAQEKILPEGMQVALLTRNLDATPNHPVITTTGKKKIGEIKEGEQILCRNPLSGQYEPFRVWTKTESAGGVQQVYNIETNGGSTFIMNGVMVLQKAISR